MSYFSQKYKQALSQRVEDNMYRRLLPLGLPDQGDHGRYVRYDGRDYLNFSSNDYLGLRHHDAVKQRAAQWALDYGAGCGASRLVTGNLEQYQDLEVKLAAWKGFDAALIMAAGYQCNASVLPALFDSRILGAQPLIFADKYIHASMHAGCAAAGQSQIRFRHNDMAHLRQLMQKHIGPGGQGNPGKQGSPNRPAFILVESIYSMDGDIAPLDELCQIRDEFGAFLIVDEAHSGGLIDFYARPDNKATLNLAVAKPDLVIGTCGKALGSFGSYVACDADLKDYLVNFCGGVVYSTGLPPAVLGAIDAALDLMDDPHIIASRTHLADLGNYFRQKLDDLCAASGAYSYGASQSHIIPFIGQDIDDITRISHDLRAGGIWASIIRPPTVPANAPRIRFALSALHDKDDIDRVVNILTTCIGR